MARPWLSLLAALSLTAWPTAGLKASSWRGRPRVAMAADPSHVYHAVVPLLALADEAKSWLDTAIENRVDGKIAGALGGSVGVIATLVGYEKRRFKTLERVKCSYCQGSGFLPCATCHGAESLVVPEDADARAWLVDAALVRDGECLCPTCSGTGAVVCCNCKGEGLSMPGQLIKNLAIDSGDLEEIMSQVSVAALQADFEMERAKQKKRMLLDRKARAGLRATGRKVEGVHAEKVQEVPLQETSPAESTVDEPA